MSRGKAKSKPTAPAHPPGAKAAEPASDASPRPGETVAMVILERRHVQRLKRLTALLLEVLRVTASEEGRLAERILEEMIEADFLMALSPEMAARVGSPIAVAAKHIEVDRALEAALCDPGAWVELPLDAASAEAAPAAE